MKINNKTINYIIFCLYSIVLFLGNDILFGFNVRNLVSYIIVILPAILILLILIQNYKEIFNNFKNNKINIILGIIFMIWIFITLFTGINFGISSIKGLIYFETILCLGILLPRINFENYQIKKIKKHLFISFFLVILYGIIEYIFNFNLDINSNIKYPFINGRVYSTFYIATLLDKYICIMFAFICYELTKEKNEKNIFLIILSLLSSVCVVLTFSRTGLLLFLGILFVFTMYQLFRKKFKFMILTLLIIVTMFLVPGTKYIFQSGLSQFYNLVNLPESLQLKLVSTNFDEDNEDDLDAENDSSLDARNYYKSIGIELIKNYPVNGIGIGNYSFIYNNQNVDEYLDDPSIVTDEYMYPHNSFVQMGAEIGIIGIIIFYLFIYSIILNVKYKTDKKRFLILNFVYLLMIAISYVEGIVYSKQFFYTFIIVFALYASTSSNKVVNKKRESIDILALHLGFGGIESSIVNIANSLSKKYKINLIVLYKLGNDISNLLNNNINVKYLYNSGPNKNEVISAIKSKNIIKFIKESFKAIKILYLKKHLIIKEIINSKSDVIISTRMEFNVLLNEYAKSDTLKIAQEHQYHNNNKKYIDTIKYEYDRIDYLLALTKTLKRDYEEFLKYNNTHTKVELIPNMISVDINKKSSLDNKIIISVGRLVEGKRVDEAIEIFSKINNDYKFIIVGDGPEKENLNNLIKQKKLGNRVQLVGYKNSEEVNQLLRKSDIFIMTSITEGLPMTLLEAMRTGVPCIAYDTGNGISDIISNSKNGFVIKNRNSDMFEKKLKLLMEDKKLLKDMSKNSIDSVQNYSFENVTDKWIKLIEKNR
ncbi:MAG: glycosyltransferase [Bacilli bacterium]|nr:glycosyltransferase [Bacilli bacterium]